jgi:hypothetical protein
MQQELFGGPKKNPFDIGSENKSTLSLNPIENFCARPLWYIN